MPGPTPEPEDPPEPEYTPPGRSDGHNQRPPGCPRAGERWRYFREADRSQAADLIARLREEVRILTIKAGCGDGIARPFPNRKRGTEKADYTATARNRQADRQEKRFDVGQRRRRHVGISEDAIWNWYCARIKQQSSTNCARICCCQQGAGDFMGRALLARQRSPIS